MDEKITLFMATSQQRSGTDAWAQFLADKPLPVKSQTIQRLKTETAKPQCSLQNLAPIISADPAFTLHLIRRSNELGQRNDNETNSVDLGISILGMDHIIKLIDEVPIIKLNPLSVPHRWYYRSLDNSLHAAFQAADFCLFPNPKIVADTKLAALFYSVGSWSLWRYAPVEMSAIMDLVYRYKKPPIQAQQHVLGCTIQEISAQLIEDWKISALASQALAQKIQASEKVLTHLQVFTTAPDSLSESQQKAMRHLMSSKYYPVKLANWFIEATQIDWGSDATLLLQQCIADLLKSDEDQSRTRLLQNTLQVSRLTQTDGLLTPAARLLMLPSNHYLPYVMGKDAEQQPSSRSATDNPTDKHSNTSEEQQTVRDDSAETTSDSSNTTPEYITTNDFKNKKLFQQACQRLLNAEGCHNEADVYKTLIHGLKEALGFERCCLLKVREDHTLAVSALSGYEEDDPMRRFSQKLSVQGLIQQLSKKSSAAHMNETNRLQMKLQMSDRFKACSHQTSFVITSLHHHTQPMLFVYADYGDMDTEISPFFFKYFKAICNAAGKRLNQLHDAT